MAPAAGEPRSRIANECDSAVDANSSCQARIGGPARGDSAVDRRIATLATAQDGVVARAQLAALGLTVAMIDHRVRKGRMAVVHRGVYAVGHSALSARGRARAALLSPGPDAVLSHRSAAAI